MKFTKRDLKKGSGGGASALFLKFEDGETKTGVCRGEIYEFYQKWDGGRSHLVSPTDPEGKSRFRVNLVVQDGGKFIPMIFEFGLTVYNQLADIHEECSLPETKIKITRRGKGMETEWSILPVMKEPLSEKQLKEIAAVPLNILEHNSRDLVSGN